MKKKMRFLALICAAVLVQCLLAAPSFAYFNRGTVSLQLGQSAVSVAAGRSVSVSAAVDPIKEQQLPGCGMPECPQSCGNTGCLNEYGECTCGGTTYQTYYSDVKAVSGNSSVATVSYGGGMLTIRGVSAGKTTVTVTGSMRQYTSTTKTISVTVTDSGNGGGTSQGASGGSTQKEPADAAVVTSVDEEDETVISGEESGEDGNTEENQEADGSSVIETKRGVYEIVTLDENTDVKSHLQAAADNGRFVTFQRKSGENVAYSWTFDGTEIQAAEDIDLDVDITEDIPDEIRDQLKGGDALFLDFAHEGQLPSEAEFYAGVSSVFSDGDVLSLYLLDEDGKLVPEAEEIPVENGYVTFSLDHCSSYILTGSSVSSGGVHPAVFFGIGAVIVAAAAAAAVLFLRKRAR